MSAGSDRLEYLSSTHTQAWISDETGIPQSTLSYVLSGQRSLPAVYEQPVINAYSREVYSIFREYGFTSEEAASQRYKNPETITSMTAQIDDKLEYLAMGHLISLPKSTTDILTMEEYDNLIQESIEDIIQGISNNKTSIEHFEDYPDKLDT